LARGEKAALARALARLERDPDGAGVLALLDAAWSEPRAEVIGLTGPPGVGKSTLTGALITGCRAQGRTVAVIAVDPSSRRSGGALLGDRVRLATNPEDAGIFVRSMAARDRLGGLAGLTVAAMVLMRALYDVVLIETVGVGQSETDVAGAADTVVFCVQPGSGDSLQFMKAGIVEIPHIVVVTKADMGAAARRAAADMAGALGLVGESEPGDWERGWTVPVLALSALNREGLEALAAALEQRRDFLAAADRLARQRRHQAELWLEDAVRERFGREGLRRAGPLSLPAGTPPFGRLAALLGTLARPA
jgi:LAO/AO transport system kinase